MAAIASITRIRIQRPFVPTAMNAVSGDDMKC